MSQEEKRPESNGPRTQIDDLPPAAELSDEEASQVVGGMGIKFPNKPQPTRQANSSTAGDPISGSDTDYASDVGYSNIVKS